MKSEIKRKLPNRIVAEASQNIGCQEEQQDYCIYSALYNDKTCETGCIAVVADGMGGFADGKNAARIVAREFVQRYKRLFDGNVNKTLIDCMQYANKSVLGLSEGGSTLVSAVIDCWKLYWLSVGDSRIYLYRNGLLRKLSIEHNYKHKLIRKVEAGEIPIESAYTDTRRNALTSYFGLDSITEYDFNDCDFPLLIKDKIVLCSDGLYKVLSDYEIAQVLSGKYDSYSDELVKKVLLKNKRKQDNVTVVILNIE